MASWSKESIEIDDAPVLSCYLLWYGREQHIPPVQGITHHELEVHQEDDPVEVVAVVVLGKALQEDAALAMIAGAHAVEARARSIGVGKRRKISSRSSSVRDRSRGARRSAMAATP